MWLNVVFGASSLIRFRTAFRGVGVVGCPGGRGSPKTMRVTFNITATNCGPTEIA